MSEMNRAAARALAVLGGACAACVAVAAHAQAALYREVTPTHLPPGLAGQCMDAAAGDADGNGNGDLDRALAMELAPNILLLNDGSGRFTEGSGPLPRTVHDSEDVAFADFDGDGDPDLLTGNIGADRALINDGQGRFRDETEQR